MLTLINPAYMTRQVYKLAKEKYKMEEHITSLSPKNPGNKADIWEEMALQKFEKGKKEVCVKFLEFDAHAKVIVTSGYSTEPVIARYQEYGFKGRLLKPFQIKDLQKELSRVLKNP